MSWRSLGSKRTRGHRGRRWPPARFAPAQTMAQSPTATGAPAQIARAHHGSVSREERKHIEEALKSGRLPAVVATSSLELGIDMGCGRPGGADRGASIRRGRPPAGGPRRTSGGCGVTRRGLPQAPRGPALVRRGRGADALADSSRRCAIPATPSMCSPSRSSRWSRWSPGPSATSRSWCAAPRHSPSCPRRPWRPRSTCCRAATRRPPSPSCGHDWSGTVRVTCSPPGREPSGSPSPAAGPSPTGACSGCSWPAPSGRPGSVSSTRRWSTSRAWATCSCSARPRGGSRTSRPTGCWCRRPPARPRACRSGRATSRAGRSNWVGPSGRSCATSYGMVARRRPPTSPTPGSTSGPSTIFSPMWTNSGSPRATSPTTAPSWSSASATSSATGGWRCTASSVRRSTAPGRSRSAEG